MELSISQLADKAGVASDTVRYYERQGLILPEARTDANYRVYNETSLERIKFIKGAQKLGFKLSEIKDLLGFQEDPNIGPNALDYVTRKLKETKNELALLSKRKNKLENLMKDCDSSENEDTSEFFNYLKNQNALPSSELIFCRHSYLFDIGQWVINGNFQINGSPSVGMIGTVDIVHNNNVWQVTRELILKDKDNTTEVIQFYIPPSPQEDITQKFVADCSVFGDVIGTIAFAGEDIFKHYEMPNQGVKGHEYLKRIHTDLYEARGVLSDGTKSITWWDYELERFEKGLAA